MPTDTWAATHDGRAAGPGGRSLIDEEGRARRSPLDRAGAVIAAVGYEATPAITWPDRRPGWQPRRVDSGDRASPVGER
jgi:transposase